MKFFEPKDRSLLALQGPKAAEALTNLTDVDLSKLYFMNSVTGDVAGFNNCRITRLEHRTYTDNCKKILYICS